MKPVFKYLKVLCKGDIECLRKLRQMIQVPEKQIPALYKEKLKTIRIT